MVNFHLDTYTRWLSVTSQNKLVTVLLNLTSSEKGDSRWQDLSERNTESCTFPDHQKTPNHIWFSYEFCWRNKRDSNSTVTVDFIHCAALLSQSCPTLCDPMDCSPPGSSVPGDSLAKNTRVGCHALLQDLPDPESQTQVSRIARGFFTDWVTREALSLAGYKINLMS